jgi:hypothetical protein
VATVSLLSTGSTVVSAALSLSGRTTPRSRNARTIVGSFTTTWKASAARNMKDPYRCDGTNENCHG